MNKVVTFHVSRIVFQIEEDAFQKLKSYLDATKLHFSKMESGSEVYEDIEARIAEIFSERITSSKQVITNKDVDEMISMMGKPEEFQESTSANATNQEVPPPLPSQRSRLYRDPDNRVIGGVCSGLAAYFNIDPVWLRIAFAVSFLCFGCGFLLYLILFFCMPKARTAAQKLEMHQQTFNLFNIEQALKKGMSQSGWKFRDPHDKTNQTFRNKPNRNLILALITVALIIFLSVGFAFNGNAFHSNHFGNIFLFCLIFAVLVASSIRLISSFLKFVLGFISILLLLAVGLAMVHEINPTLFNHWIKESHSFSWNSFSSSFGSEVVTGNDVLKTESRGIVDFSKIETTGSWNVEVKCQEKQSLEISADENLLPLVQTKVSGKRLLIFIKDGYSIKTNHPITLKISVPNLEKFSLSGSGNITIANVKNEKLVVDTSGSGDFNLSGETNDFKVDLSGSGDINAKNLRSSRADIDIAGSGSVQVFATNELNASIAGSGDIAYYGNPQKVHQDIAGVGKLIKN
jgi:phage shock protein PspC (stress-responsive transcriptional regulator)